MICMDAAWRVNGKNICLADWKGAGLRLEIATRTFHPLPGADASNTAVQVDPVTGRVVFARMGHWNKEGVERDSHAIFGVDPETGSRVFSIALGLNIGNHMDFKPRPSLFAVATTAGKTLICDAERVSS